MDPEPKPLCLIMNSLSLPPSYPQHTKIFDGVSLDTEVICQIEAPLPN